jgi:hypothetical protein
VDVKLSREKIRRAITRLFRERRHIVERRAYNAVLVQLANGRTDQEDRK